MTGNLDFIECDACRAKPGSPALCDPCLHNRHVISVLHARYHDLGHAIETFAPDLATELVKRWRAANRCAEYFATFMPSGP